MYPFGIRGITENKNVRKVTTREISHENSKKFALNEESSDETLRLLIRNIPHETQVIFYDKDYPSPSDPGAYVSFMRVNNEYLIERGNYGWSNEWMPMGTEELVTYLLKCSESHKMVAESVHYMSVLYERKVPELERIDRNGDKTKKKRNPLERRAKGTIVLIGLIISLCVVVGIAGNMGGW